MFAMFGFERSLTALWLGGCYALFAVSVLLAHQLAEPLSVPPRAFFPQPEIAASTELISEPIPGWEIVTVPVALDRPADQWMSVNLVIADELPRGIELLDSAHPIQFLPGQDQTQLRWKIDWRSVREYVAIPLQLSMTDLIAAEPNTTCELQLFPLPRINASVAVEEFLEGTDEQIVIDYQMEFPFPQPVQLSVELQCDESLVQSLPKRKTTVEFPPGETKASAVFLVPDNELATGDRPIRVVSSSDCTRFDVLGKTPSLIYNDDERVYDARLLTVGLPEINEDDPADRVRTLKLTLSEPCGPKGLEVPLQILGDASEGTDYLLSDKRFRFSPEQTEAVIELNVLDDKLREGTETLTMQLLPDKMLRFTGTSSTTFYIRDSDPLLVRAKLSDVPLQLFEGEQNAEATLSLSVIAGQTDLTNWSDKQRSTQVFFTEDGKQVKTPCPLELIGADGRPLPNQLVVLGVDGTATVKIRAHDDRLSNGVSIGQLGFKTQAYVDLQVEQEMVVVIEDDDPLPAKLSIEGTTRSIDGNAPAMVLDESEPRLGLQLAITLDEPADRDITAGLRIFGKADENDVRLGPSEALRNNDAASFRGQAVRIPKGTEKVTIPIKVVDDDAYEVTEDLIFDLVPSLGSQTAKILIYDNDPVIVGFSENPLVIREGKFKNVKVMLKNAPDGLTKELPFTLVIEDAATAAKQIQLRPTSGAIPAQQGTAEIAVAALADDVTEGRQSYRVRLELPPGYQQSSFYKVDAPLDVWVEDPGFEATRVVVLVVTPNVQKNWPTLRTGLASLLTAQGSQLAGGGIVMVGADATPVTWNLSTTKLPVEPLANELPDSVLTKIVRAIYRELPASYESADATVLWDVTDRPDQLPSSTVDFPQSSRLALSMLFYGLDASNRDLAMLKLRAKRFSTAARKHRLGTQSDPLEMPLHLERILQSPAAN